MQNKNITLVRYSGIHQFLVNLTFKNRLCLSDFFKVAELVNYKPNDDFDDDDDVSWGSDDSSEKSKDNELKSGKIEVPEGTDVNTSNSYYLENVMYDYAYYPTNFAAKTKSDLDRLVVEGKLFYRLNDYHGESPLNAIEHIIVDFEFWIDEKFVSLGNVAIKYSNVQANANNIRSNNKTLQSVVENINVISFATDNDDLPTNIKFVSKDKTNMFHFAKLQRTDYKLEDLGLSFNFDF